MSWSDFIPLLLSFQIQDLSLQIVITRYIYSHYCEPINEHNSNIFSFKPYHTAQYGRFESWISRDIVIEEQQRIIIIVQFLQF